MPDALAFFGGVRFVPIITTLILIPVVVVIWFVTYYIIFRFAIIRFNIKTPEREIDNNHKVNRPPAVTNKSDYDIPAMLAALGGKDNIVSLDNCITRLRLSVKNISLVDNEQLKNLRILGIIYLNQHNLQIVIGPQVQSVKDELDVLI